MSNMKGEKKMTAVQFAKRMEVDYTTVMRWLKLKLVPGAILEETAIGTYWQIPESSLNMERPKAGRKRGRTADKAAKKSSKAN